jgi:hypothetical protein
MGMAGYISVTNLIKQTAAHDDPYADWAIVQLEEKLMQAKAGMLELTQQLDRISRTCRPDRHGRQPQHPSRYLAAVHRQPAGFSGGLPADRLRHLVRRPWPITPP